MPVTGWWLREGGGEEGRDGGLAWGGGALGVRHWEAELFALCNYIPQQPLHCCCWGCEWGREGGREGAAMNPLWRRNGFRLLVIVLFVLFFLLTCSFDNPILLCSVNSNYFAPWRICFLGVYIYTILFSICLYLSTQCIHSWDETCWNYFSNTVSINYIMPTNKKSDSFFIVPVMSCGHDCHSVQP